MRTLRAAIMLGRHTLRLGRTGQLRFRLETFGVYYPAFPYAQPWWRISPPQLFLLLRQAPRYADWLSEMDALRREGAATWWAPRSPREGASNDGG
ncbi:MAG TPA: hypothetical protein VKX16_04280 [Chloroflexota bacterium]|nr:hypothetical protein [Chloroflexota bacterium]